MNDLVSILVPIFICVVLPVAIVWIVYNSISLKTVKRSEVIMEAIRANPNIDTEKLIEAYRPEKRGPWEYLNRKLLRGSIFTLISIAFALIAIFNPDSGEAWGCWIVCGICGAVGIGFLVTYWFAYKHIEEIKKEKEERE